VQHRPNRSDSIHFGMDAGVDGPCNPIDPHYLSDNVRAKLAIPSAASSLLKKSTTPCRPT
jgi:hypothetical protein